MDVSVSFSDVVGSVKMHHTFNGAAPIPRGWLVCDGSIISQTNYDAIHGTGAYVSDGVVEGPLAGKYIPNLLNRYAVGAATTAQDGSTPMGAAGNANHTVNLTHVHKWYQPGSTVDNTFDGSGNPSNLSVRVTGTSSGSIASIGSTSSQGFENGGNANFASFTDPQLGSAVSAQPDSMILLYIIKVI